jgi:putative acetyltransferase
MQLRDEVPADHAFVREVLEAAFSTPAEANLVDQLRRDGHVEFSLVALEGTRVVGHAMLSRMDAPFRALALGPVAVHPRMQRAGAGTRLIREGLARAERAGWQGVFVLGSPVYYGRFGFTRERAAGFTTAYPRSHFLALVLGPDEFPVTSGRVDYAPAFAALG